MENDKPKKKIKKITLSYSMDAFETLCQYHKAKGIAESFLIGGLIIMMIGYFEYDHVFTAAVFFIFGLMYRYYQYTLEQDLTKKTKWKEKENEEQLKSLPLAIEKPTTTDYIKKIEEEI